MKKKLFRGLAAALCAAMMAGSVALPAYAAGPSRESVPYADSYASYQWAFLNTGELRLVPSHTAAVDAAIGAITGFHTLGKAGAGQGGAAQLFDIFRAKDAGNVLRLILERVDIHGFAPLWI